MDRRFAKYSLVFIHLSMLTSSFSEAVAGDPESILRDEVRLGKSYRLFPQSVSPAELKARGRQRAERDYATGWGEIEIYGFPHFGSHIDLETGLYIRYKGCCIVDNADIESEGYNQRLKELIFQKGPPAKVKGLKARCQKSLTFKNCWPLLSWTEPLRPNDKQVVRHVVGPYEIHRLWEGYQFLDYLNFVMTRGKEPLDERVSREVRIVKESEIVADIYVGEEETIRAAYWKEPELIVLEMGKPGERYVFADPVHGRIMLDWRPGMELRGKAMIKALEQMP